MRSQSIMRAAALVAALLGSASCSSESDDQVATPASAAEPGDTALTTGGSTPMTNDIDPGLQPYIDIAVTDLAERLVDATDIIVTSATLVVWPDSSLGCPAPGQQYAQVSTDGALIVLQSNGTDYPYHAGGSREPFLCEKPGKSLTGTVSTEL